MAETWAGRIMRALHGADGPLDDDMLAARLGATQRQTINQVCRRLEAAGELVRRPGPAGKIVNIPSDGRDVPLVDRRPGTKAGGRALLTEDEVKAAVQAYLEGDGWRVTVAWGHQRGVDIEAHRGHEHLYLEAKGEAANPPQQVNYFLGALGELVQRLRDPSAQYGLALPDNPQYRSLLDRLPPMAWERLNFIALLVDPKERGVTIREGPGFG